MKQVKHIRKYKSGKISQCGKGDKWLLNAFVNVGIAVVGFQSLSSFIANPSLFNAGLIIISATILAVKK